MIVTQILLVCFFVNVWRTVWRITMHTDVTTMSSKMLLKKHNLFFSKTFAKSLMRYI